MPEIHRNPMNPDLDAPISPDPLAAEVTRGRPMCWFQLYRKDFERYREYRPNTSALVTLMAEQGLWALLQYRISSAVFRSELPRAVKDPVIFVLTLWRKLIEVLSGISIAHQADIGPGFYIGHFGNIFIGGEVTIGEECNIFQGVSLGISGRGNERGMPTLGSRVYISPNAVVAGKIKVGDDVVIGANSLVISNVSSGWVVIGVPARVVSTSGSKEYLHPEIRVDPPSLQKRSARPNAAVRKRL
jgi:serine O-acetyltransferase